MEKKKCLECSSENPSILLHNVPHRGGFAQICTACVLSDNRDIFCPICYQLHRDGDATKSIGDLARRDSQVLICRSCPALAHVSCLPPEASSAAAFRYACPNCSRASFSYFDFRFNSGAQNLVFTRDLAMRFLCAAKIASMVMNEAAIKARVNAEEKAREALIARYKAREAIHRVAYLTLHQSVKSEPQKGDN